ncbi:MAG TPA: hypothetical protein VIM56_06230 [Rhizomicrobium sp.]
MQLYTGQIRTLNDCARAGKNLMVECQKRYGGCSHMRGFDPFKLRHIGKDAYLGDIERRMRCDLCGLKVARILIRMSRAEWYLQIGFQPMHIGDRPEHHGIV